MAPRSPAPSYRIPYYAVAPGSDSIAGYANVPALDVPMIVSPIHLPVGLYRLDLIAHSSGAPPSAIHLTLPQAPQDLGAPPPVYFLLPESEANLTVFGLAHRPVLISLEGSNPGTGIKQGLWGEVASALCAMWLLAHPHPVRSGSFRILSSPKLPPIAAGSRS